MQKVFYLYLADYLAPGRIVRPGEDEGMDAFYREIR